MAPAPKSKGGGQGRVRIEQRGYIVHCTDADCRRVTRMLVPRGVARPESWHCGLDPYVPKAQARVGQQKQVKR